MGIIGWYVPWMIEVPGLSWPGEPQPGDLLGAGVGGKGQFSARVFVQFDEAIVELDLDFKVFSGGKATSIAAFEKAKTRPSPIGPLELMVPSNRWSR